MCLPRERRYRRSTQAAQQEKQNDAAATGDFRITGRVVNSMTDAPVAGAYVLIASASSPNLNRTVRAGTDGSFVFTQIPAGPLRPGGAAEGIR